MLRCSIVQAGPASAFIGTCTGEPVVRFRASVREPFSRHRIRDRRRSAGLGCVEIIEGVALGTCQASVREQPGDDRFVGMVDVRKLVDESRDVGVQLLEHARPKELDVLAPWRPCAGHALSTSGFLP